MDIFQHLGISLVSRLNGRHRCMLATNRQAQLCITNSWDIGQEMAQTITRTSTSPSIYPCMHCSISPDLRSSPCRYETLSPLESTPSGIPGPPKKHLFPRNRNPGLNRRETLIPSLHSPPRFKRATSMSPAAFFSRLEGFFNIQAEAAHQVIKVASAIPF